MKFKVYSLSAIIIISSLLTINLLFDNQMVVYRLGMNNTPALQNEPMIGNNTSKWETEYKYLYKGIDSDNFNLKRYKKYHQEDVIIVHSSKGEKSIKIYSNQMPDEDYFLNDYRIGPTL